MIVSQCRKFVYQRGIYLDIPLLQRTGVSSHQKLRVLYGHRFHAVVCLHRFTLLENFASDSSLSKMRRASYSTSSPLSYLEVTLKQL